eukprot:9073516-Lingulodinium_polyedra.AAC.1
MDAQSRWGSRTAPVFGRSSGTFRRPATRVPTVAELVLPLPVVFDVVARLGDPAARPRAAAVDVAFGRGDRVAKK